MRRIGLYASIAANRLKGTLRAWWYRMLVFSLTLRGGSDRSADPRSVVLVSTSFTPSTWGGVFRPVSICKALANSGYKVTVLTQSGYDSRGRVLLPTIERGDANVEVVRLPSNWLKVVKPLFPSTDGNLAEAYYNALYAIRHLNRSSTPGLVLASGPEFDNFTAARLIADHFNIPLVLDYRDEWTDCPFSFVRKGRDDHTFERLALESASLAVYVTQSCLEKNIETFGGGTKRVVIPNGVDLTVFSGARPASSQARTADRRMRVSFVGSFEAYVDPLSFVKTVRDAQTLSARFKKMVRFEITGRSDEDAAKYIIRNGMQESVVIRDPVPHHKVPGIHARSDVLLVLYPPLMDRTIPGKFFEYMATSLPIWVVGTVGEVPDIVRRTEAGICSSWGDAASMVEAAERLLEGRDFSFQNEKRDRFVSEHTREKAAARIVDLVCQLVTEE